MVEQGMDGFVDISVVLKSGVYALVKNNIVIYIGKSKSVYQRIYTHRHTAKRAAKGQAIPSWLPVKGFVFDQVLVFPCHVDQLDKVEAEMINKYQPRYNVSLKKDPYIAIPLNLKIGAATITVLGRPADEAIRRV